MKANLWRLEHYPKGKPTSEDLVFQQEPIKELEAGDIRIRTRYLSLDPANRLWIRPEGSYMPPIPLGSVMPGVCIGVVEASRHPRYQEGQAVQGLWGWQDVVVLNGGPENQQLPLNEGGVLPLPEPPEGMTLLDFFGILGVHGMTAFFGMMEEGKIQAGQTVLVSAAAGAVGSLCVQIARNMGCRVIGLAGSEEKCRQVETLGAEECINYKCDDVASRLRDVAPDGFDLYFDNVGGAILEAAIDNMKHYGRIVFCGAISQYNDPHTSGPGNYIQVLYKELTVKGYLVATYMDRMAESIEALAGWAAEGKLTMAMDVRSGIENALETFNCLFDGSNQGKLVLQISPEA